MISSKERTAGALSSELTPFERKILFVNSSPGSKEALKNEGLSNFPLLVPIFLFNIGLPKQVIQRRPRNCGGYHSKEEGDEVWVQTFEVSQSKENSPKW
jgi:hypothetical protein